jgi:hypothetical protein
MGKLELYKHFDRISIPKSLKGRVEISGQSNSKFIENLSKINVFVGSNNSGKSYLLREILISHLVPFLYDAKILQEINKIIEETKWELENSLNPLADSIYIQPENIIGFKKGKLITDNRIFPHLTIDEVISFNVNIEFIQDTVQDILIAERLEENGEYDHRYTEQSNQLAEDIKNIFYKYLRRIDPYILSEKYTKIYIHNHRSILNHKVIATELKISVDTLDAAFILDLQNQYFNYNKDENFEYSWKSSDPKHYKQPHILPLNENPYCDVVHLETGIKIYEDIFYLALNDRRTLTCYEEFLSEEFFDSKLVTLIPTNEGDSKLKIQIGEEESYPIYKLGTGLQMIITLTFPLFKYKSGIMFVEEPELFVHPGLQKQLMKIYATHERAKNFMFFIATHSNHILDTTLYDNQISIFSVKKSLEESTSNPKFILQNLAHGDDNALTQLGVSNSSVFLANCTIWVEGVTDRMYISRYIEVYQNYIQEVLKNKEFPQNSKGEIISNAEEISRFKEGIHFSFVYSAGDSIVHWDFNDPDIREKLEKIPVKYLCGKAFVIVDNDFGKNPKRKEEFDKVLGEGRFEVLSAIEIENLLSLKTISRAINSFTTWNDIKISMSDKEFKDKIKQYRLGTFIDDHLLKDYQGTIHEKSGRNRKAFKKSTTTEPEKGVTIKEKVSFAENAIPFITWEDMTEESKKLVEKLFEFIKANNS